MQHCSTSKIPAICCPVVHSLILAFQAMGCMRRPGCLLKYKSPRVVPDHCKMTLTCPMPREGNLRLHLLSSLGTKISFPIGGRSSHYSFIRDTPASVSGPLGGHPLDSPPRDLTRPRECSASDSPPIHTYGIDVQSEHHHPILLPLSNIATTRHTDLKCQHPAGMAPISQVSVRRKPRCHSLHTPKGPHVIGFDRGHQALGIMMV